MAALGETPEFLLNLHTEGLAFTSAGEELQGGRWARSNPMEWPQAAAGAEQEALAAVQDGGGLVKGLHWNTWKIIMGLGHWLSSPTLGRDSRSGELQGENSEVYSWPLSPPAPVQSCLHGPGCRVSTAHKELSVLGA